jgi:hypothetical protein
MPQREEQAETKQNVVLEQTPWLAKDVSLDDPQRYSGPPLVLSEENVIDVLLDGDSIRRV